MSAPQVLTVAVPAPLPTKRTSMPPPERRTWMAPPVQLQRAPNTFAADVYSVARFVIPLVGSPVTTAIALTAPVVQRLWNGDGAADEPSLTANSVAPRAT